MIDIILLRDYNTRIVVLGTVALGITCGVLGVFLLLRKRALLGDALSHAALPGIGAAYLLMSLLWGTGRNLLGLLVGATVSAFLAMGVLLALRRYSKLKEDTIIALILSTFFGLGIVLLSIIQKSPQGHAAGLQNFIYGDTASMVRSDLLFMSLMSLLLLTCALLFFKEIGMVIFNQDYAASLGYRPLYIDIAVICMTVLLTVVGLQAVGLILIIALLIVPAVAARFWVQNLKKMCLLAALFGALGCYCGALLSARFEEFPAGAAIVLVAGMILIFSILLGKERGLMLGLLRSIRQHREIMLHRLFLALRYHYDLKQLSQSHNVADYLADYSHITHHWLTDQMRLPEIAVGRITALAHRKQFLRRMDRKAYRLTTEGLIKMIEVVRNHELYHAFISLYPQRVQELNRNDEFLIEKMLPVEELESVYQYLQQEEGYLLHSLPQR